MINLIPNLLLAVSGAMAAVLAAFVAIALLFMGLELAKHGVRTVLNLIGKGGPQVSASALRGKSFGYSGTGKDGQKVSGKYRF